MAENYKVGEKYFLPVRVFEVMDDITYAYPVRIEFENGNGCMDGRNAIKGNPNLLLTAEEVAETRIKELEAECEKYRQSNIALRRTVDALTASEDRNTHRAMLMDALMIILLEKINEMRR